MMPIKDQLVRVKQRIARGWVQKMSAASSGGMSVPPTSAIACRWCLVGALCAEYADQEAWTAVEKVVGNMAIWNDTPGRTKEQVLEALDEAIRLA